MWNNFELYFEAVKVRNAQGHTDGHEVVFQYAEKVIEQNRPHFERWWKRQVSPHKALVFFTRNPQ